MSVTPVGEPPEATTDKRIPGIQLPEGLQAIESIDSTTNNQPTPIEIALIGDLSTRPRIMPIVP